MNEAARPGELTGRDLALAAAGEIAARNPAGRPRRRVPPTVQPERRRRRAAARCTVLDGDTRRDPLDPDRRGGGPPTGGELDEWAATITHFRRLGLPCLPPADVRAAMYARRERYAAVFPVPAGRRPAA